MRCEFHPEALAELDDAASYYTGCQLGLGLRFLTAVRIAIHGVCESPERWKVFDGEIRRCLVHVFPYAVLYSIEDGFVYLVAVMHCSREPGYWRNRLRHS